MARDVSGLPGIFVSLPPSLPSAAHNVRTTDVLLIEAIHAENHRNFVPYTSSCPAHLLAVYKIEVKQLSS